jgi:hypothetical protein
MADATGLLFFPAWIESDNIQPITPVLDSAGPLPHISGECAMVTQVGRLGIDDFLFGGRGEPNGLTGDASAMAEGDRGGDDWLFGGSGIGSSNGLTGDAGEMTGNSRGGNDVLVGGRDGGRNDLWGDANFMSHSARGANDRLFGGEGAETNFVMGDGEDMGGRSAGGNDLLVGGDRSDNWLHGDGVWVEGDVRTGADTLVGGNDAINFVWGDGWEMGSSLTAGRDVLVGGRNSTNFLSGDANWLWSQGGDDRIIGGAESDNELLGDARYLFSRGGNDRIYASNSGTNVLYGDAYQMHGTSIGGDDRLVSGHGDDDMWGDAKFRSGIALDEADEDEWYEYPPEVDETVGGADVFVFRPSNGEDTIHDFEQGKDLIELRNFGLPRTPWDFDDLSVASTADGCVIALGEGNSITLLGVDELTSDDVRFRADPSWGDVLVG